MLLTVTTLMRDILLPNGKIWDSILIWLQKLDLHSSSIETACLTQEKFEIFIFRVKNKQCCMVYNYDWISRPTTGSVYYYMYIINILHFECI